MLTSDDTVAHVVAASYGISIDLSTIKRYPSYDDQMVYFTTSDTLCEEYILKIHALGVNNQSIESLQMQNDILLLLQDNHVNGPRIIPVKHALRPSFRDPHSKPSSSPSSSSPSSLSLIGDTTPEQPSPHASLTNEQADISHEDYYSSDYSLSYLDHLDKCDETGSMVYFAPVPGHQNASYIARLFTFLPGELYRIWREEYLQAYNTVHSGEPHGRHCGEHRGEQACPRPQAGGVPAGDDRVMLHEANDEMNDDANDGDHMHQYDHTKAIYLDAVHHKLGRELALLQTALSQRPFAPEDINIITSDWDPRWTVGTVTNHQQYLEYASDVAKQYANQRYDELYCSNASCDGTAEQVLDHEASPSPSPEDLLPRAEQRDVCPCGCVIIPSPNSVVPQSFIEQFQDYPPIADTNRKTICDACRILEYKCGISLKRRQELVSLFTTQFSSVYNIYKEYIPYGIIHNDINESNIIFTVPPTTDETNHDHDDGCGQTQQLPAIAFIDYGDTCISHPIFDLSIAISYLWLPFHDALHLATVITKGYASVTHISPAELRMIIPAALGRILISVVIAHMKYRETPWNEYVLSTSPQGWKVLDQLYATYGSLDAINDQFLAMMNNDSETGSNPP